LHLEPLFVSPNELPLRDHRDIASVPSLDGLEQVDPSPSEAPTLARVQGWLEHWIFYWVIYGKYMVIYGCLPSGKRLQFAN